MAKKDRKKGKPTLFVPEVRRMIILTLRLGQSQADAARTAGIAPSTLVHWKNVGYYYRDGIEYSNLPKRLDEVHTQEYIDFLNELEKAIADSHSRHINNIMRAAQDKWRHRKTGEIRLTPPGVKTWLHEATGQIVFDNPEGVIPGPWKSEWSAEAWEYIPGIWQSSAWFLERSDPDNWGRQRIEFTGKDSGDLIIKVIRDDARP